MHVKSELKGGDKRSVPNGTQDTIGSPLTKEITMTVNRPETFQKQRQIKTKVLLNPGEKTDCTRPLGAKTEVISLAPN